MGVSMIHFTKVIDDMDTGNLAIPGLSSTLKDSQLKSIEASLTVLAQ
jgi:hypothetical protein